MKKLALYTGLASLLIAGTVSCEKEQPAKEMSGNYTGVLEGRYEGVIILEPSFAVRVSEVTKNKVLVEGDLFRDFEVLVTQQGINVDPVSTNSEVVQFLYQGEDKELSFTYVYDGDSAVYVGTKP